MKYMVNVGKNVKAEMARNDITQEQLADMLGICTATLRHRLEGRRVFTLPEMAIMAQQFGCTIDYLAGYTVRKEVS